MADNKAVKAAGAAGRGKFDEARAGVGGKPEEEFQESIEEQNDVWEPITKPFILKQAYSLGLYDEDKKKKPAPIVGQNVAEAKKLFEQKSLERQESQGAMTPPRAAPKGKHSSSAQSHRQ